MEKTFLINPLNFLLALDDLHISIKFSENVFHFKCKSFGRHGALEEGKRRAVCPKDLLYYFSKQRPAVWELELKCK